MPGSSPPPAWSTTPRQESGGACINIPGSPANATIHRTPPPLQHDKEKGLRTAHPPTCTPPSRENRHDTKRSTRHARLLPALSARPPGGDTLRGRRDQRPRGSRKHAQASRRAARSSGLRGISRDLNNSPHSNAATRRMTIGTKTRKATREKEPDSHFSRFYAPASPRCFRRHSRVAASG